MILTSLLNYYNDELKLVDRENYDKSNVPITDKSMYFNQGNYNPTTQCFPFVMHHVILMHHVIQQRQAHVKSHANLN